MRMKIVLTEINGDQEPVSREFKQPTIKIGRDQLRSNLAFNRERWPAVSRVHAEIRFQEGRWFVTDLGSTHGTLVNGHRIAEITEIQSGSQIQLGLEGPVLRVEVGDNELPSLPAFPETKIDEEAAKQQAALRAKARQPEPVQASIDEAAAAPDSLEVPVSAPSQSAHRPPPREAPAPILICESGSPTQVGLEFELNKDRVLIGREADADISIEAGAATISRRHAVVVKSGEGNFEVVDLNSFNGTLVNDRRITQPTPLSDGDRIQLAPGGPVLRFSVRNAKAGSESQPRTPSRTGSTLSEAAESENLDFGLRTIISRSTGDHQASPPAASAARLLFERPFNGKQKLTVGRGAENDIQLDGLLISKSHARFINSPAGVLLEDAGSTNGVYLNGGRISGRQMVQSQDVVQIGPFVLKVDPAKGVAVFDCRSTTRIDAIGITDIIPARRDQPARMLLNDVSLAIEPNEFVGVLGPSGAGKSMLMKALNGMRRTTSGTILINNLELYQHVDSLKQSIGYVPQDDLIHRELTVYRTIYYVARLRLSHDVPANEIDQIIGEVLDVTGLSDRRDVPVSQLSGGQRKRVSIAVELLTKPSVIFLDEPTSGLDPATEERIMRFFRQIAESGHTVILTTHAMENVRLFDRIVLLLRGRLIFYGTPAEALEFTGASNFIELYNRLETPLEAELARLDPLPSKATRTQRNAYDQRCEELADAVAEKWRSQFMSSESYVRYIQQPLSNLQPESQTLPVTHRRRGILDSFHQWITLVRRYVEVLASDKWNLTILLAQAPIIALLLYLVVGKHDPRDFLYFILALVSIWFGTSVAARQLIIERPIFERERMVNLGLVPYLASKLVVLAFILGLQVTLLFGTLKLLSLGGLITMPGFMFGLPQLAVMALTGVVGTALGLFISALVKTPEMATSLVTLILIPQILFAGLATVPAGVSRAVGAIMPATWSFDAIKRLSSLDTLKMQGSNPNGPNQGRGLYQHTRDVNAENASKAHIQLEEYNQQVKKTLEAQERAARKAIARNTSPSPEASKTPAGPAIGPPPSVPEPQEIEDNLSQYVSFKHPWGGPILDPAILAAMLLVLLVATLIALKARDIQ
jgi:ABC transport system ATP-binding/permease protein